jgi:hypothetical protein
MDELETEGGRGWKPIACRFLLQTVLCLQKSRFQNEGSLLCLILRTERRTEHSGMEYFMIDARATQRTVQILFCLVLHRRFLEALFATISADEGLADPRGHSLRASPSDVAEGLTQKWCRINLTIPRNLWWSRKVLRCNLLSIQSGGSVGFR